MTPAKAPSSPTPAQPAPVSQADFSAEPPTGMRRGRANRQHGRSDSGSGISMPAATSPGSQAFAPPAPVASSSSFASFDDDVWGAASSSSVSQISSSLQVVTGFDDDDAAWGAAPPTAAAGTASPIPLSDSNPFKESAGVPVPLSATNPFFNDLAVGKVQTQFLLFIYLLCRMSKCHATARPRACHMCRQTAWTTTEAASSSAAFPAATLSLARQWPS